MTPAQEHILYRKRPDLWGVTRCMIHCRNTLPNVAAAAFAALPEDDKQILKELAQDSLPDTLAEDN